jgi:hypothetical protein
MYKKKSLQWYNQLTTNQLIPKEGQKMTEKQEIRAFALAIAVLNNRERAPFVRALKGEKYTIELNDRQIAYLKAIEDYIETGNHREAFGVGWRGIKELI